MSGRIGRPRKEHRDLPTNVRLGHLKYTIDALRLIVLRKDRGLEPDRSDVIRDYLKRQVDATMATLSADLRQEVERKAERLEREDRAAATAA